MFTYFLGQMLVMLSVSFIWYTQRQNNWSLELMRFIVFAISWIAGWQLVEIGLGAK